MLAKIKARGTNEIADIFDKYDIDTIEIQVMECTVHHVRIEVAGASGRYLYRRHAFVPNPVSVVFRFKIALHNGDLQVRTECIDGRFQQRCLAGTRR